MSVATVPIVDSQHANRTFPRPERHSTVGSCESGDPNTQVGVVGVQEVDKTRICSLSSSSTATVVCHCCTCHSDGSGFTGLFMNGM